MPNDVVTMDKIVALCKRRGLIFPASEIYGGIGNTYDYGHYGVLLKNNVKDAWWQAMVFGRDDIVALDSAIIQHPQTWKASGHLAGFTDPLVDCKTCGQRFRADHLDDLACPRKPSKHPGEFADCELTEAREFNLMFETTVGPVKDAGAVAYLRPETAQGIFLNFKNTLQFARKKPPFGIAQVGKSFRNEITPGNFIFRTREFEQMEMEFFVPPDEAQRWYEYWCEERRVLVRAARHPPRPTSSLRPHDPDELSHYSSGTSDVEYLFPIGWSELEGIANRGDFDLSAHAAESGAKLTYKDANAGVEYVPHVIEPAAGADRALLAFLCDAYDEDEIGGEHRTVLRLHPARADQGGGLPPAAQGRPPRARARGLRVAAFPRGRRVRRRRQHRQALPPPGRDRHPVRRDDRPPVARGPHRHAARPRHARPGAAADRRVGRRAGPPRQRGLAFSEARMMRSSRSAVRAWSTVTWR